MNTQMITFTVVFNDRDHDAEAVRAAGYAVDCDTGWLNFHDNNGHAVFSTAPNTVRSIRAERADCCCEARR